ncbi:CrcB family protein [Propionimicrobium sp. PCR01-08-3]|uniref:fluoride efflux transporter FluC n=1 Tax=Propionimicrobium sp. PCR01-08-3 TaxID=3052086 RepID=UPI00255CFDBF|nr:CrcB family protein [Propionimicrobium sp. PCR01-08-3]WIY82206.1 CrcB family protein [Propionimicrobium sp. PCR01-08-3]
MIALWVAICGGLGAGARFTLDGWLTGRVRGPVPLATFTINAIGSFILGLLTGWIAAGGPADVKAIAGVGFCGGFTTFSTASVELARLVRSGRHLAALGLGAAMFAISLAAALGGIVLGRLLG